MDYTPTEISESINMYESLQKVINRYKSELNKSINVSDDDFESIPCVMSFAITLFDVVLDTLDGILEQIARNTKESGGNDDLYNRMVEKTSGIKENFYNILNTNKNGAVGYVTDRITNECLNVYRSLLDAYKTTIALAKKTDEAEKLYKEVSEDYPENDVISSLNPTIIKCRKTINGFPSKSNYEKLKADTENDIFNLSEAIKRVSAEKNELEREQREYERKIEEERKAKEEKERLEKERLEKERLEREKQERIAESERRAKDDINYLTGKLNEIDYSLKDYSLTDDYYELFTESGKLRAEKVTCDFDQTATISFVDFVRTANIEDLISSDAKRVFIIDDGTAVDNIDSQQLKSKILSCKKELVFSRTAFTTLNRILKSN